jgi:putative oxygen-independent coproporphyrinogen III oxidase
MIPVEGGFPLFLLIPFFVMSMNALAVYVHWPYCQSICPYCHFNRYLAVPVDWPAWERALHREIAHWAHSMPDRPVRSVFFGGGTPSLMDPAWVRSILAHIQSVWPIEPQWEVTLEMNPNEAHRAPLFAQAGVNRFSMGVQSFDPEALALLGRTHRVDHLQGALDHLRTCGAAYSFDLIYGHALHADTERWARDVRAALPWIGDHVSLYQLTYEQGTPFYKQKHCELDEDTALCLEQITKDHLTPLGLEKYEISNYARPHAQSQHNLMYWTYQDFVGIGPGAHGRVRPHSQAKHFPKVATHNWGKPDVWMDAVTAHGHGAARQKPLTRQQCAEEQILMGLRLDRGLAFNALIEAGEVLTDAFQDRVGTCRREGLLCDDAEMLCLTFRGQCLLNSVVTFLCQGDVVRIEDQ